MIGALFPQQKEEGMSQFYQKVPCRGSGCRSKLLIDPRAMERGKVERRCGRCGTLNRWTGARWVAVDEAPVKQESVVSKSPDFIQL